MKKKILKIFWAWDFMKEEEWLNKMSAKGLHLVAVNLFQYIFEEGPAGEYSYRLELLEDLPSTPQGQEYIRFMEETGAEQVASYFRWVYFRKKGGEFEIFSDIDSKIKHLNRILSLIGVLCCVEWLFLILNFLLYLKQSQHGISLGACLPLLVVTVLLTTGVFKVCRQRKKLQSIRKLHE